MLPEPHQTGSPEEWLRYARSDLMIAKITPTAAMMLEGLCFHAQQTAEKALKAILSPMESKFPGRIAFEGCLISCLLMSGFPILFKMRRV